MNISCSRFRNTLNAVKDCLHAIDHENYEIDESDRFLSLEEAAAGKDLFKWILPFCIEYVFIDVLGNIDEKAIEAFFDAKTEKTSAVDQAEQVYA
jgi:hypothetical protein